MKRYIYRINNWFAGLKDKNAAASRDFYLVIEKKGTLNNFINESESRRIVKLTVIGLLDGNDIDYILHNFPSLRELDISDCIIYEGKFRCPVHNEIEEIKANRVVPHMFHIEKLRSLTLPFSATDLCLNNMRDSGAFINTLENLNISERNSRYSSLNGVVYDKLQKTLLKAPPAIKKTIIPEGVNLISRNSFKDCRILKTLSIPDTVTYIGDYAFENCPALKVLKLPESLLRTGIAPFGRSVMMSDIYCPAKTPPAVHSCTVDTGECRLHVPEGTSSAYVVAPFWKYFRYIDEV